MVVEGDYVYAGWQAAIVREGWHLARPMAHGRHRLLEVVLLPGIYEHWSFNRPLGDSLSRAGHRYASCTAWASNHRGIADTAGRLARTSRRSPRRGRVVPPSRKQGMQERIISLSSCSTMWQCHTNWPGVVELQRTRVTWPG